MKTIKLVKLLNSLSGDEDKINAYGEEVINKLNLTRDFEFISLDTKRVTPFTLLLSLSGGIESKFLSLLPRLTGPIYILVSGYANSLAASLEIKSYCDNNHISCTILLNDDNVIASLNKAYIYEEGLLKLKGNTLGVIGMPSDWLISSNVDYGEVYSKTGINLKNIGLEELYTEIDKKKFGNVKNITKLRNRFPSRPILNGALEIYGALKRLIEKYNLSGFTIRCFDLIDKYKNTACLALGMLNSEGYTCGCEGDIPTLLTMHIAKNLTGELPFQCNPAYIDEKKNEVIFAHCTLPIKMAKDFELMTHYESDKGVGIRGKLLLQDITLLKFNTTLTDCHIYNGNIEQNLTLPNMCRTQIKVKLSNNTSDLLTNPYGNHMVVIYGDHREKIEKYLKEILQK